MKFYSPTVVLAFCGIAVCAAQVEMTIDNESRHSLRHRELRSAIGVFATAGAKINKFLCTTLGINRCICDEGGLRSSIAKNEVKNICFGSSIAITTEIDISGKDFGIGCDGVCNSVSCIVCTISGAGSNRLLAGSPTSAVFTGIAFTLGSADNGGVASLTGGSTEFVKCNLVDNKATASGGAIFATGSSTSVVLDASQLKTNKAANGGAVHITSGAKVTLVSTIILSNTASSSGGAVYVDGSTLTDTSSDFYKNSAPNGGALAFKNGKSDLTLSAFSGNTASTSGSNIYIIDDGPPPTTGSNVGCDGTDTVKFCGALGISEVPAGPLGTQFFDNTDCDTAGTVVAESSAACTKF